MKSPRAVASPPRISERPKTRRATAKEDHQRPRDALRIFHRRWVTLTSQCGQWKWLPKALGKLPVALQTLNGQRACRSIAYRRCHHPRLLVCAMFTSQYLDEHNFAAVLSFKRVLLSYLFSCTRLSHSSCSLWVMAGLANQSAALWLKYFGSGFWIGNVSRTEWGFLAVTFRVYWACCALCMFSWKQLEMNMYNQKMQMRWQGKASMTSRCPTVIG